MALTSYQAKELFQWLIDKEEITVLDVRNDKDFSRFQVEGPYPFHMLNVSYYDFMEIEEESVAKVPEDRAIRIVCAKEGSAKYVGEILEKHNYKDVRYLTGGIKTWGNLLVPKLIGSGPDYELYQCIRPGKASCSYALLSDKEMMVFDPSRAIDFYIDFAKEKGATIIKTFETHLQADYIAGSRGLAETVGAKFYGNEGDFKGSENPYIKLVDGEIHNFSETGPDVRVLFTPGHTPGSTCYVIDEKYIITGDMVFINSVGRPDLGGKAEDWAGMLYESMLMVKKLDPALLVLPGHYIDWNEANSELNFALSLGEVIKRNESIYNIDTLADFVQFIKENMRPQPEEYATIRLVNANLEQHDDEKQEILDLGKNECAASAYAAAQQTQNQE
jgi:glyoxylase-like metal-dependent hydrolase (beta-lactamase superfamily II)